MVNHQIENIVKGIFPSDRDKSDPRICQEVAYFSIALIKHNREFNLVSKFNFKNKLKIFVYLKMIAIFDLIITE